MFARYEIVAASEEDAIDAAWAHGEGRLLEWWEGEERHTEYHSIEEVE
jgi:hypothetical protein